MKVQKQIAIILILNTEKFKRIFRTGIHVQVQVSISMGKRIENPTLHHIQQLIPDVDKTMKSTQPKVPEENSIFL